MENTLKQLIPIFSRRYRIICWLSNWWIVSWGLQNELNWFSHKSYTSNFLYLGSNDSSFSENKNIRWQVNFKQVTHTHLKGDTVLGVSIRKQENHATDGTRYRGSHELL